MSFIDIRTQRERTYETIACMRQAAEIDGCQAEQGERARRLRVERDRQCQRGRSIVQPLPAGKGDAALMHGKRIVGAERQRPAQGHSRRLRRALA